MDDLAAKRATDRRIDQHSADDPFVGKGRQQAVVGPVTQAADDEGSRLSRTFEIVERRDVGHDRRGHGCVRRRRARVSESRLVESQDGEPPRGKTARDIDVEAARSHTMFDTRVQQDDGRRTRPGRRRRGQDAGETLANTEADDPFAPASSNHLYHPLEHAMRHTAGADRVVCPPRRLAEHRLDVKWCAARLQGLAQSRASGHVLREEGADARQVGPPEFGGESHASMLARIDRDRGMPSRCSAPSCDVRAGRRESDQRSDLRLHDSQLRKVVPPVD